MQSRAVDALLAWYDATGRRFAFRETTDPYAVLVSETMAQQTQIERAAERWGAFLGRFPTIGVLAAAPLGDVLREWRGLGYNRRAVNLHRAARLVVERHGGRVPSDVAALEALPGVGPYTARAVAALAFGEAVGAVDTNVRRVLARLLTGGDALTLRDAQALADATVPPDRPAAWTHAVMDLGATVCRPVRPRCDDCPVRPWCSFAAGGGPVASRAPRRSAGRPAFPSTSRWLRGQILDRLRDAVGGAWVRLEPPIGEHDATAIERALAAMCLDGLVERNEDEPALARLPGD